MSANLDPCATIEKVTRLSMSEFSPAERLTLELHYGHLRALIELSAAAPLFEQEPLNEVARRSLGPLIDALEVVADEPGRIVPPAQRRT